MPREYIPNVENLDEMKYTHRQCSNTIDHGQMFPIRCKNKVAPGNRFLCEVCHKTATDESSIHDVQFHTYTEGGPEGGVKMRVDFDREARRQHEWNRRDLLGLDHGPASEVKIYSSQDLTQEELRAILQEK